jgi:hypothetical protein
MFKPRLLLFIAVIVFSATTRAGSITDTTNRNSLLYNGVEYTRGYNYNNETPFFQGSEFLQGEIRYTGNLYSSVALQYDCIDDVVILKDPLMARRILLIKEKVDEFTLGGHHFIKLGWLGTKGEFYEELYKGKRSVLVQWKKNVVLNMSLQERYELVKTTYLLEGKTLTKITKASELTKRMGDKKKKIQQYYRENDLSFRNDPETAAVRLVQKAETEGW